MGVGQPEAVARLPCGALTQVGWEDGGRPCGDEGRRAGRRRRKSVLAKPADGHPPREHCAHRACGAARAHSKAVTLTS